MSNNIGSKGLQYHPLGLLLGNTPGTQVKNSFLIQLSSGRAMATFYIVCINLQLGFAETFGFIAKQNSGIGLIGIGFLSIFMNKYLSVENACGTIIQNPFVQFVGDTIGFKVVHMRVVIHML